MAWLKKFAPAFPSRPHSKRAHLRLETLETRLTPYSVSGNAWANPELITISFLPDGTSVNGQASNLFATFNAKFGSATTWQNQILKAAQVWAQQTNLNFAIVSDDGSPSGSGNYQQGDPDFGDIRIGGYNFGNTTLAQAYLPPPANNYSVAGDIQFNTAQTFNVGSTYDLFTVAMHEFGHALGLYHGGAATAMAGTYGSALSGLATDDINGIRNVYSSNAARAKDSYDNASNNDTSSKATTITSAINSMTKAGVLNNLDLTTTADADWYKFVVPSGSSSTLRVKAISQGLSLLDPKVEIYNSSLALQASGTAGTYGGTATATLNGIAAGQTYFVRVFSTTAVAAFKTGRYALVLNVGTGADPAVTSPNTQKASGTPLAAGGGQAISLTPTDVPVNTTTPGVQLTSTPGQRAVATDLLGNYVVTWASEGQDGSGFGIYAQRYDSNGQPQGGEFRVNSTTSGNQASPAVAMDALGNFVITWTSSGQDGSGQGVYARLYSLLGLPLSSEFRVNSTTSGDQASPAVAMDALGNFVITWTSSGQDGSGQGVYAKSYTVLGLPLSGEFRVNATTAGDQTSPAIAYNSLVDKFVITWASYDQDANDSWGIYARRFGLLGLLPSSEVRVNTTTQGDQITPSVAVHRVTGAYVIVWAGADPVNGDWDVYAQRFSSTGRTLGDEVLVNTTTLGDQTAPCVALDSAGNSFITWSSYGQDGSGDGVFGQLLTAFGEPLEGEFSINVTTAGDQWSASVAVSALGQAVVVWTGNGPSDSSGVMFQRFSLTVHAFDSEGHHHDHDHGDAEDGHVACAGCQAAASSHSTLSVGAGDQAPTQDATPRERAQQLVTEEARETWDSPTAPTLFLQGGGRRRRAGGADAGATAQESLADALFASGTAP